MYGGVPESEKKRRQCSSEAVCDLGPLRRKGLFERYNIDPLSGSLTLVRVSPLVLVFVLSVALVSSYLTVCCLPFLCPG